MAMLSPLEGSLFYQKWQNSFHLVLKLIFWELQPGFRGLIGMVIDGQERGVWHRCPVFAASALYTY